ncbi:hypothetical protein [Mesorhizobium australafricanum]|uniref:Uncharacterized protein n=1 Tax=Mesorhizobium australafricanum TaxID=3072311 RepID=A0ABU4X4C6_9HYPH|nr:hypothetical protein [Mesorhizobium sp. VK3E]MDX8442012.1 hypothetical protein [Mesorhizobium sp. VK3E]
MSPEKIIEAGLENFDAVAPGAYYGSAAGLSLGAGLIYAGIQVPFFDTAERRFEIIESLALVITNECDVANERAFDDHVLVCPIIPLRQYAESAIASKEYDHAINLIKEIALNRVNRVFFLPPAPKLLGEIEGLTDGGLMNLNMITATHVDLFKHGARPLCAFSAYAQGRFDRKLEQHLLRPKTELLPRTR